MANLRAQERLFFGVTVAKSYVYNLARPISTHRLPVGEGEGERGGMESPVSGWARACKGNHSHACEVLMCECGCERACVGHIRTQTTFGAWKLVVNYMGDVVQRSVESLNAVLRSLT